MLPEPQPGGIRVVDVVQEALQEVPLALLDRLHDRREQSLPRPEVVEEHPVAGPDLGGERPQAGVAHPVLGEPGDAPCEQLVAGDAHAASARSLRLPPSMST